MLGYIYREFFVTIDVLKNALLQLPIAKIDNGDPNSKRLHDRLVALVDKMLTHTPALRAAKSDAEKTTLQNALTKTDREIDQLVYQLYGLTPEEIALVEGLPPAGTETALPDK